MSEPKVESRARTREIAAEFAARGDATGWFEALYKESEGNPEAIPWADLAPNRFFQTWAEYNDLKGEGRTAIVVGCGLGDDARYLHDLGFKVTAFDISPTAIQWAKKLHKDTDILFEVADLFNVPPVWRNDAQPPATSGATDKNGFDFVLEVYTIQPLPLEMRPQVVDAIAAFVAEKGSLVIVTRGREDDMEPDELPWPMSRIDLSRFEQNGLTQVGFTEMPGDDDEPPRFVVEYISD